MAEKWKARLMISYTVEVEVEADSEDEAVSLFDNLRESDGFTAEQLAPQGPVDIEFDEDVWS